MKNLKLFSLLLALCLLFTALAGCGSTEADVDLTRTEDIVILFTNDIHCSGGDAITVAEIAAYKKMMEAKTKYVYMVDCGDSVQGSSLGSVTEGSYAIDVMNEVGYDFAIFGNHEFDYGPARLIELVTAANAQYLCCNMTYSGTGETPLTQTKPYAIVTCGDTDVAFIGVTTPHTLGSCAPVNFMENDAYVYDFCGGETVDALAACVQKNVDEARSAGADYVVLLAHMGYNETDTFSSNRLIASTTGIDAVLDGHSHETYTKVSVENKNGEPVLLAQTGTKLTHLGQLVISPSGILTVSLLDDLTKEDETVKAKVETLTAQYETVFSTVVATSNTALSDRDEYGIRAVRNRETGIGDLCADAYRAVFHSDIAYVNGGGIRASLPEGDITYQDIIEVNPFGNMLCLVEVTGQEILDMLEYFVQNVQPASVSEDKTKAIGESGSFPCISGMTFTVDTRIESPVLTDESDSLCGFDETKPRRVSDVKILSGEEYLPLDVNKTYTLASHDYMIKNGGSGMKNLLADHTLLQDCVMPDYQALLRYIIEDLNGDLSAYQSAGNRIQFLR